MSREEDALCRCRTGHTLPTNLHTLKGDTQPSRDLLTVRRQRNTPWSSVLTHQSINQSGQVPQSLTPSFIKYSYYFQSV